MLCPTADAWTDKQQHCSYIAVTVHWIGREPCSKALVLRSEVITFYHLPYDSHSGAAEAGVVLKMLDRAGITGKVCM